MTLSFSSKPRLSREANICKPKQSAAWPGLYQPRRFLLKRLIPRGFQTAGSCKNTPMQLHLMIIKPGYRRCLVARLARLILTSFAVVPLGLHRARPRYSPGSSVSRSDGVHLASWNFFFFVFACFKKNNNAFL